MALYIVPTPIGNLQDITERAVVVLRRVDFIIAEDSRYSQKLLNHFNIKKRIISHYRPKEETQAEKILALLTGQDGALITDSGTPAISDPGFILIAKAIARNIPVIPLPGPTAFVPALVASGIDPRRFIFLGFPPRGRNDLHTFCKSLAPLPYTMVFYESPRRSEEFLRSAAAVFGARPFALAKELSKKHETIIRGRLDEWPQALKDQTILGEIVIVIAGTGAKAHPVEPPPLLRSIEDVYVYFRERHGLGKNLLKKILMQKKAKKAAKRGSDAG
ncbi:MAG: 16S rRNA (cytidine(1402)-2'-O)-methyltransferase [Candidatus Aminicenantes bacterium]|nr:16S rRNA (cytidine(1402)-2'-O)-methyltransferase [Candidatus Aminicenantes bacterium]